MAEKETKMKLKVNLQCSKCYEKVKKVLSKFPQIRAQEYDDKQNIVTITVVCCNPEKIRDKICCHGGCAIKTIEIVEHPVPKPKPDVCLPPCIPGGVSVGVSVGVCCVLCYEWHPGGPCRRPVCDSYGGGRRQCVSRCDQYFSEENSLGCSIM